MPADLNIVNGKASMFYVGDVPWHQMGTKLDKPATAEEAIAAAGLDWDVQKWPLAYSDPTDNTPDGVYMYEGMYATVRMDTKDPLGTVTDRYEILQNRDAFSFLDPILGKGEGVFVTAGALGLGERIWGLVKLPDYIKVMGGKDVVEKYLLVYNAHDGKAKVRVKFTPIRVVCSNTLQMALRGADQEVGIRHTDSMKEKLETAAKILGVTNQLSQQLEAIFNKMSVTQITDKQLKGYVASLFPLNPEAKTKTRTENVRAEILNLYETGSGAGLTRGTLWGAYNSVTEFVDHVFGCKKTADQRLNSMWFGVGGEIKEQALTIAANVTIGKFDLDKAADQDGKKVKTIPMPQDPQMN